MGRWDLGHLPVRELVLDASFMPDELKALRIDALQARLGAMPASPAGARSRPMAAGNCKPSWTTCSPSGSMPAWSPAGSMARWTSSGGGGQPSSCALTARPTHANPLRLRALLTHEGERWRLDEGEILAAGGRATLSGQLDPAGSSTFTGRLADFDPSRLWRGSLPAMRLNGQFDGQHSAQGERRPHRPPAQPARQQAGRAAPRWPSQVGARRNRHPWGLQLQLQAGQCRPDGAGSRPGNFEGRLRLQAPQLSELNTLKALHPALAHIAGKLKLDTSFALSHPSQAWRVVADGQGESSQLRWGDKAG